MPTSEPNADAPVNFWIGEYDAQQIADTIGMSWAGGAISMFKTRMVNIPDLCSAPPPSAPTVTTLDLANALIPGPIRDAALAKMEAYVDSYTWSVFCHYTDATPAHVPDTQGAPDDLPPNLPGQPFDYLPDIWRWLEWMRRHFHPLGFYQLESYELTDAGEMSFPMNHIGEWPMYAMGVNIAVTAFPDYSGRSGGGEPAVHYDFGWFSLGNSSHFEAPYRLQRVHQVATSRIPVQDFAWNLAPGVTAIVSPLYPITAQETEG